MISVDALVLQASRDLGPIGRRDDARLNSTLAGAAYKLGFSISEETAAVALMEFKRVLKKRTKGGV